MVIFLLNYINELGQKNVKKTVLNISKPSLSH